jgi:hypothetical protein
MRSLGPLALTERHVAPNGLLRDTAMQDGSLVVPEHSSATAEATNVCSPISESANVVSPSDCNGKNGFIESMSTSLRTGVGESSRFGAIGVTVMWVTVM